MWPWLQKLIWDESAFERYARALFFGIAGLAATGQLPEWAPPEVAALLMALAGWIGAGDKNLTLPELRKEERDNGRKP